MAYKEPYKHIPPQDSKEILSCPSYFITVDGKIWSTKSGKYLKPHLSSDGHWLIELFGRTKLLHRLILEAWKGPCPSGLVGCHNDGNPNNNHIDNLRWDTRSSNVIDAVKLGTHTNVKLTDFEVLGIIRLWETQQFSAIQIAEKYNINRNSVYSYIKGERRAWIQTKVH